MLKVVEPKVGVPTVVVAVALKVVEPIIGVGTVGLI